MAAGQKLYRHLLSRISYAGIEAAASSCVLVLAGDALCVCDADSSVAAASDSAFVAGLGSRVGD